MQVLIFDDMQQCREEELERLMTIASKQRREQALKFKTLFSKFACLKSYEMLIQALGEEVNDNPPLFTYNKNGKPYLKNFTRHFNISHCHNAIAVAVASQPIGIDIESYTRNVCKDLIEKTMNDEEIAIINSAENMTKTFIELWTKKEATLKMYGTGIIKDMKRVLNNTINIKTYTNNEKSYIWSIASSTNEKCEVIICK